MGTVVMRVPAETHALLARLARRSGRTLADELAAAVAAYERQQFFDELEAQLAALQADPAAWTDYQAEARSWEATLRDGLEDEAPWTEE